MNVCGEVYGLGGYDPDHPSGNVVERLVDLGDGTAQRQRWDGKAWESDPELVGFTPWTPPLEPHEKVAAVLADTLTDEQLAKITDRSREELAAAVDAAAADEPGKG